MQLELKQLQRQVGITFIYVTHDQEEALTMSDRIAVMNLGHLLQVDDPVTIYERPTTQFVADFIGETNFVRATVTNVADGFSEMLIAGEKVRAPIDDQALMVGQTITLTIRPEKLALE